MAFSRSKVWLVIVALGLAIGLILFRGETRDGARNPLKSEQGAAQKGWVRAGTASASDVRRILQQDATEMLMGLNELGVASLDQAAVQVLVNAWSNSRELEPDLNWSDLERTDVRFALGGELVRAHVNGFKGIPIEDIANFGRRHLGAEPNIARAMYLVVLAGTEDDVRRVEDILSRTESPAVYEAGISALSSTCMPEAAAAIDRIRNREQDEFRKALIAQVQKESAAFRARLCGQ